MMRPLSSANPDDPASACIPGRGLIFVANQQENVMAFDPMKTLETHANAECSVQMWLPDAEPFHCSTLRQALSYAIEKGGKWNEVELTVHRAREDIVYGTDKTRMLIDAQERAAKAEKAGRQS
jgi:hypothetical protein